MWKGTTRLKELSTILFTVLTIPVKTLLHFVSLDVSQHLRVVSSQSQLNLCITQFKPNIIQFKLQIPVCSFEFFSLAGFVPSFFFRSLNSSLNFLTETSTSTEELQRGLGLSKRQRACFCLLC